MCEFASFWGAVAPSRAIRGAPRREPSTSVYCPYRAIGEGANRSTRGRVRSPDQSDFGWFVALTELLVKGAQELGVYDLIAAAEWRASTSRYSALEQSDRTHGRPTQASPTLHHRKQTRASVAAPNGFGVRRMEPAGAARHRRAAQRVSSLARANQTPYNYSDFIIPSSLDIRHSGLR